MNKHLVFVSYELYPINQGGCGVFIWTAVRRLLEQFKDIDISLVLDIPLSEVEIFKTKYMPSIDGKERLKCFCVSEILQKIKPGIGFNELQNLYLWKSYQFYKVLEFVHSNYKKIDYIEFFDYVGIGFYAIRAQKYMRVFDNCITAVRAHCTVDLMDIEQKQIDFNEEKIIMYQMEKMAIQDCDILLSPSEAWGKLYCKRYGTNEEKVIISPPVLDQSKSVEYKIKNDQQDVLFYGRIFELKGVDVFVDAAITFLYKNPQTKTRFILVGYSVNSVLGKKYSDFLIDKIPSQFRNKFVFTGHVDINKLNEILETVAVAVFPNYVESFCYSIHELYIAGIPIICRPIEAFINYFEDEKNCLYFNGTSFDISNKLEIILTNHEYRKILSYPYNVLEDGVLIDSYSKILNNGVDFKTLDIKSHLSEKISLVLLDFGNGECENLKLLGYSEVVSKNSYILKRFDDDDKSTLIWFLGSRWKVSSAFGDTYDEILRLDEYYWIGLISDLPSEEFFNSGLRCMKNDNDLDFFGSIYKNNYTNQVICRHFDLECFNIYGNHQFNIRLIRHNPNMLGLRDLYDSRLGILGGQVFKNKGYIIPEVLININDAVNLTEYESIEERALQIHKDSRGNEWNPYILSHILNRNNRYIKNRNFIRSIYHMLNNYFASRNDSWGKMGKFFISRIYDIIKNKKS